MCGICGIVAEKNTLSEREQNIVSEMKARIRHRGPDDDGLHVSAFSVLGHQRLSVIDLEHGQQPMTSRDGRYVLVFNGEIYNYLELRQDLEKNGTQFDTASDTEVLLQMLIQQGADALSELNGMFAFLFLDTQTGGWILGRDSLA